ncbi:MAG: polyprenyl synthetase [Flavobacteriaceae bacterium]|jgi:octaprenyl-diphosphate synthase|nr:MAG: polyprenyl synthetase [Flavobacteriaceae bacterium]|tara:strand:- start:969 stop:1904 length:936 start_codon:yes stop_codon:yes gene_type:complete
MEIFEEKFSKLMLSKVPLLNRITHYIIKRKGKQMRPMFIFLFSKLLNQGIVNEKVYRGASVIELIHTATLIHDDVVDDSKRRRGFFSINAIWKNKIAVLVGDFLLSRGMILCIENKDYDHLDIISESVKKMSEGELLQIEKSRSLDIDETVYFEIIKKKTASLISSCCKIAAVSVTKQKKIIESVSKIGENIGIAFQIKDDLFDYGKRKIGKPRGIDIKEKKLTLPLIYTLNEVDNRKRKWIINSIKKHNTDKSRIKEIISLVKETGGLEYAIEKMNYFHKIALEDLNKLPDNEFKSSLTEMINYVIQRDF